MGALSSIVSSCVMFQRPGACGYIDDSREFVSVQGEVGWKLESGVDIVYS